MAGGERRVRAAKQAPEPRRGKKPPRDGHWPGIMPGCRGRQRTTQRHAGLHKAAGDGERAGEEEQRIARHDSAKE